VGGDGVGAVRVGVRIHRRHGCWLRRIGGGGERERVRWSRGAGLLGRGLVEPSKASALLLRDWTALCFDRNRKSLGRFRYPTQERYATCIALLQRVINEMLSRKKRSDQWDTKLLSFLARYTSLYMT
jgi:hypothetical protein